MKATNYQPKAWPLHWSLSCDMMEIVEFLEMHNEEERCEGHWIGVCLNSSRSKWRQWSTQFIFMFLYVCLVSMSSVVELGQDWGPHSSISFCKCFLFLYNPIKVTLSVFIKEFQKSSTKGFGYFFTIYQTRKILTYEIREDLFSWDILWDFPNSLDISSPIFRNLFYMKSLKRSSVGFQETFFKPYNDSSSLFLVQHKELRFQIRISLKNYSLKKYWLFTDVLESAV